MTIYEAIPAFTDHLLFELPRLRHLGGALYADDDENPPRNPVFWFHNRWDAPIIRHFSSITDAATQLRAIQRNWVHVPLFCHRRAALISVKLPPISEKPRTIPWIPPDSPLGAWTLLDENTLLASPVTASPFPGGIPRFIEDKIAPPSRAYLKLAEAFSRLRVFPASGEKVFDAGASPGGWTWLAASLGADVVSCDRAPLDDRVAALPNVHFIQHDAFTLRPADIGKVDWLLCDAACYPARLAAWLREWLSSGLCGNYICTLKMQGKIGTTNSPDFDTPRLLAALPGAVSGAVNDTAVVHLFHNKHELTLFLRKKGA